jgi:membrane protein DedA with SNARE-associated domain
MWLIYLGLFVGMILEGDVVLLTGAFLSHQRIIHALPAFLAIFAGVMIGDYLWYWLGAAILPRWPVAERVARRLTRALEPMLERQFFLAVFICKFTYGLNHAILARAGLHRIDRRRYFKTILAANLIWVSALGGVGYFASSSFGLVRHYVKYGEIALLVVFVGAILLDRAIGRLVESLTARE